MCKLITYLYLCLFFLVSVAVWSLSHGLTLATPCTVTQLLCPWDFPGKNAGVGCHFLLQGLFLTQGLNPSLLCLLHWQVDSLPLSHQGSCFFVVVGQPLSRAQLFMTLWTATCQVSLSFTISQSLLKLMSIELMMPSNHLILLSPSPPALNLSEHQCLFQWVNSLHQVARVLELQLKHQFFQWIKRVDFL